MHRTAILKPPESDYLPGSRGMLAPNGQNNCHVLLDLVCIALQHNRTKRHNSLPKQHIGQRTFTANHFYRKIVASPLTGDWCYIVSNWRTITSELVHTGRVAPMMTSTYTTFFYVLYSECFSLSTLLVSPLQGRNNKSCTSI